MQVTIAWITWRGFCAEAPLSRNTSFLPRYSLARMGKSARMAAMSKGVGERPSIMPSPAPTRR